MRAQDVLVVTGTGFIGTRVVRALAAAGHRVTVYHRGHHEPDLPAGVRHVRSPDAAIPVLRYPRALHATSPDAVVLMVPLGAADARAAADTFRGRAGRLVAVSSGDVYAAYGHAIGQEPRPQPPGQDDTGLLDEDAPLRAALYPYGREAPGPWGGALRDYDKLLVERVVLSTLDLPGTVLRLPAVYGPGDWQRRFAAWLRRMDDGRPRLLLGALQARWRWTHGFVEDVAAAIALAATDARAASRVYNVGEAHTPTVAERLRALARAAGWDGELVTVADAALPASLREPVDHTVHLALDTARLRRELGYAERVGPEEALARTVAWERASPAPRERLRLDYAAEDAALAASR